MINHHPKGGMCSRCTHLKKDCSHLDFKVMRVIENYGKGIVVKCTEFERVKK